VWSLAERGAKHVAILSSSGHAAARHRRHRSLVFSLTLPPLPQNSRKSPGADYMTSAPHRSLLRLSPTRLTSMILGTRSPYNSATTFHTFSKITGTVWSRREPAARRSSPAHPRSWQVPLPFPGQARKRQALYPHYSYIVLLD
jgi:hypothetical protein